MWGRGWVVGALFASQRQMTEVSEWGRDGCDSKCGWLLIISSISASLVSDLMLFLGCLPCLRPPPPGVIRALPVPGRRHAERLRHRGERARQARQGLPAADLRHNPVAAEQQEREGAPAGGRPDLAHRRRHEDVSGGERSRSCDVVPLCYRYVHPAFVSESDSFNSIQNRIDSRSKSGD